MQSKTVYQIDHDGFFTGVAQADECQFEEGVWLIPAGCVESPPPITPEGKAAHWGGSSWSLVDNLIGRVAYECNTGRPIQIDRLGALPLGYTLEAPAPYQVWRDNKWQDDTSAVLTRLYAEQYQAINSACEQAITAGFQSDALGATYQYSSQLDDQLNLTGAILRGLDMPYACRDEQGVKAFRLHTAAQLRQVGDDFTLYKLQLLQRANELKQQLDLALAAGDAEAMQTITWEGAES